MFRYEGTGASQMGIRIEAVSLFDAGMQRIYFVGVQLSYQNTFDSILSFHPKSEWP